VVTSAGAQPTPPATLRANLVANVVATNPGYTANLPGSLVEDWASTGVGAITISDSAVVETINSISPYTANDFLLAQLGQIYIGPGAAPGVPTNVSVSVVFTATDPNSGAPLGGVSVNIGFTVGDGTYQYVVQDGGVTGSNGQTQPLFCLATIAGQWAVATGTVSQLVTAPPAGVNLSCTNPLPGISNPVAETSEQYRTRVVQAGQAVAMGTTPLLKTLLGQVPGVQQRLVSTVQQPGGWTVIVGGGDPYLTAGAILKSGVNIAGLVGATLSITNITQANPAVVTTATNHNYQTGTTTTPNGVIGMVGLNGVLCTVTVLTENTFSINQNTISFPPYEGGGTLSPNPINLTTNIYDAPNTYGIVTVTPPAQTVTVAASYHPTAPNFSSQSAIAQAVAPVIAAYLNSIFVGAPISLIVMTDLFLQQWEILGLDPSILGSLSFAVSINGISTAPTGNLVLGDPWSYFAATTSSVTVAQT
jgi:hypothetical protein